MVMIGKNFEVGVKAGEEECLKHIPKGVSGRNHSVCWEHEIMFVHFGGLLEGKVHFVWFCLFSYLIQIYLFHL